MSPVLDISLWFFAIGVAAICLNRWLFVRVGLGDILMYSVRDSNRKPIRPIIEDKLTAEERAKLKAEQDRLSPLDGRD